MAEPTPELERSLQILHQQASSLHKGAMVFVGTAMLGLGGALGVFFFLWRDWKLGYNVHPPLWEPLLAGMAGGLVGLGLAVPFVIWFRLQANLVHVQLSMEEHTRRASFTAEATVQGIQALADAGMSGEWRMADRTYHTGDELPVDPDKI
jgi:hypothetical protein